MIQLKQVSKNFQRQQVLDRLDLQVIPGDRIALIGQNGAGKTTLIRSLLGQYEHQGTLRVFQKDPRIERVGVLQHVGFVPQHPPPLQMNVGELVAFADADQPRVIFRARMTCSQQLFKHNGDFDAIGCAH